MRRAVIVGASLAGLYSAEALRVGGFDGQLTIIGAEPHAPYDRPPLSKTVLTGRETTSNIELPCTRDVQATWMLGARAVDLDRSWRKVLLADGRSVAYDALLIATGARARPWPDHRQARLRGVHVLREREDADRLRADLVECTCRVLVIGGGFTGCEAASSCRDLGLPVTLVHPGPIPLSNTLGQLAGGILAREIRAAGVDLRVATEVRALVGDAEGKLTGAVLSNGDEIDADVAIVALGAVPNVEWLSHTGLLADARGLECDAQCRALAAGGSAAESIYAAGDVTRWQHPLFDLGPARFEHWGNAAEQARVAAHNMLATPAEHVTCDALPAFWSDQFGLNIKAIGVPAAADQTAISQTSRDGRGCVAVYGRRGRLVGAVAIDYPRVLDGYAAMIRQGAAFPPKINATDAPARINVVPTRLDARSPDTFALPAALPSASTASTVGTMTPARRKYDKAGTRDA